MRSLHRAPLALLAASLFLGLWFPASARAASYFINARGALGDGSGSSAANAADASTPQKYRAINQTRSAPGTVIVYAPGTYLVTPAFSMFDGVSHQGAGIDATIVKIEDGAAAGPFAPMWLAEKGTVSRFGFFDATIDFNSTRQPWWTANAGSSIAFAFSTADHCTVQRVKFVNMGARKRESFPVFFIVGPSSKGNLHHNLVDSCVFTQPVARGNTDGLTCVMMADAAPGITVDNTNVVSRCRFLDLKAPEHSDLPYSQCCTCPVATDNEASGVDALWFIEPGTQTLGDNVFFKGQTVQVTGNTLADSGEVALILMHPNGNFAGELNVQNNRVGMTAHPYFKQGPRGPTGVSVEQYWAGDPPVGKITVRSNTFVAPTPAGTPPRAVSADFAAGSGHTFRLAGLAVLDNTFVNVPPGIDALHVTKDPARNPNFTQAGNVFGAEK